MDKSAAASAVLKYALAHVPFDGWSMRALIQGAKDANVAETDLIRIFPGGVADALKLFAKQADAAMLAAYTALNPKPQKIREKIAALVRLRLEALAPNKEAARRALAAYALPAHASLGLSALTHTVDEMWHAAGDTSTDFNWYTKRLLLSGVYTSTLLVWLNDKSEGHAHTWEFLNRRIENVMWIQKLKSNFKKQTSN